MSASTYNFTIEQGATFLMTITWDDEAGDPIDLTDYTAALEIRSNNRRDLIKRMTSGGGGLTMGGPAGTVVVLISNTDTAAMDFTTAVYDLELTASGVVTRVLQGTVTLSKEVTTG